VKSVGPKAATIISPEGEPTWRAVIRKAKWYDRQVRRNTPDATPREVDTALAEIYKRRSTANHTIDRTMDLAHRAIGDRKHGRSEWRRTDISVENEIRELVHLETTPWSVDFKKIVASLDDASVELARCDAEQRPLDDQYYAAPWARFFLVTSSDGHIHSSMSCSTCRSTTEFGWLPELSGQTEADAVVAHGPLLCSVCFPSAPVEWTVGKPKAIHCDGMSDPDSAPRRVGMNTYRRCTCGSTQIVNADGNLRKHKPGK
jgi:hypothetical protein